jgi:hypothetical protein
MIGRIGAHPAGKQRQASTMRFFEFFFRMVGLDKPVKAHKLDDLPHIRVGNDKKNRTIAFLDIAEAVDENRNAGRIDARQFFEVKDEMMKSLFDQFDDRLVDLFVPFVDKEVPFNMDHFEFTLVRYTEFHIASLEPATCFCRTGFKNMSQT